MTCNFQTILRRPANSLFVGKIACVPLNLPSSSSPVFSFMKNPGLLFELSYIWVYLYFIWTMLYVWVMFELSSIYSSVVQCQRKVDLYYIWIILCLSYVFAKQHLKFICAMSEEGYPMSLNILLVKILLVINFVV